MSFLVYEQRSRHGSRLCKGCLRPRSLSGVLLVGRPHLAPGSPGPSMLRFSCCRPGRTRMWAAPVSRWLESVFFAFVKFIMCLLVPEVKAVSCAQVLHMQVLESTMKRPVSKGFREGLEMLPDRPLFHGSEAVDSLRFRLLKYQLCEPIVHDMLKLWRTQTVNTAHPFSPMAQRGDGHALHLSTTPHRTQTSAGEHHAALPTTQYPAEHAEGRITHPYRGFSGT